jgi:predicted DNA binding CopG/RHH family protein
MKTKYIDNEERELINSLNGIDFNQIENDSKNTKVLQESAKEFIKKQETKINIRISSSELDKIKEIATREGLKYQTFVKSILHKYITGQLVDKKRASL